MYQCKHNRFGNTLWHHSLISACPRLPSFNVMLKSRNLSVSSTHRNYFSFCGSPQLVFWLLFWFKATAATRPKDSKLTTACSDCASFCTAVLFIVAELSGILVRVFVDCDMDGVKHWWIEKFKYPLRIIFCVGVDEVFEISQGQRS